MSGAPLDPSAFFASLINDTDVHAATDRFRALMADVIETIHPEIQAVVVDSAIWGEGVYVGELGTGARARVWQSTLSIQDFGSPARKTSRNLLEAALATSNLLGYQLKSWTLVVASDFDPSDQKAWNSWAKSMKKTTGVTVDILTARTLRRRLLSPEGVAIRQLHLEAAAAPLARTVQQLEDATKYEDTLFVRQLKEARVAETFSAKAAYFNAEILGREVADKSIRAELDLLLEWRMHVQATWTDVFNEACHTSNEHLLPSVLKDVLGAIREDHGAYTERMRASIIHGVGIMHQAVEDGDAGWVRDWRDVVDEHNEKRPTARQDMSGTGGTDGGL